jgi:hypothetical protein
MGYNFYITRAAEWSQNEGHEILPDEWLAIVQEDPELTVDTSHGKYLARWTGPSEYPDPWFDWHSGNIMTKNPDFPILDKMVALAHKLNARVVGESGEPYPPKTDLAPRS